MMRPGTDKLLAKATRALATAESALTQGALDVAAGRAFYAMLNAAKARLNESGLRPHTHVRIAAAYETLPEIEEAPAAWLGEALALRARMAAEPEGLAFEAVDELIARARRFVEAAQS